MAKKSYRCSVCGGKDHNKRTCGRTAAKKATKAGNNNVAPVAPAPSFALTPPKNDINSVNSSYANFQASQGADPGTPDGEDDENPFFDSEIFDEEGVCFQHEMEECDYCLNKQWAKVVMR